MVTHPTTSLAIRGLSMGERTGSRIFHYLWPYVLFSSGRIDYEEVVEARVTINRAPSLGLDMKNARSSRLCKSPLDALLHDPIPPGALGQLRAVPSESVG